MQCKTCMRLAKKNWASRNKEKVKAYESNYRLKNKESIKKSCRKWREENRSHTREYSKKWKEENPDRKRETQRAWYEKNSEHAKNYSREWRLNNPEQHLKQKEKWIENNRDRHLSWRRDWWRENSDRVNAERNKMRKEDDGKYRELQRSWYERAKHREEVKVKKAWRGMLWHFLQLAKLGKSGSTHDLLGYSPDEFRLHIERQFTKGMSWENHGEWHIDHIVPLAEHVKNGVKDPAVANCLTNLQPIWAKENLRKNAQKTHLI